MGICKVKIEHNNRQKIHNFFVVPGNMQALLGMPNIEILIILTIHCNTISAQETDKATKGTTHTANGQGSGCKQHYTIQDRRMTGLKSAIQMQKAIQIHNLTM